MEISVPSPPGAPGLASEDQRRGSQTHGRAAVRHAAVLSPTHLEVQVCDPAVVKVSDGLQHLPQVRPDLPFGEVSPSHHAVQESPLVSPAEAGRGVAVSMGLLYFEDLSGLIRNKHSICPLCQYAVGVSDSTSTRKHGWIRR